jgi:hypothetical protein
MNVSRTYTTRQLAELIGASDRVNFSASVLQLADRIGIAKHPGAGRPVAWSTAEAFAILVAHRTAPGSGGAKRHDVTAACMVIELVRRGYVPRWVLWSPVTGYARASAQKLEALWARVPRDAIDAGVRVLNLSDVLEELEGV